MLTQLDAHVFESPIADCGNARDRWAQCLESFTERNVHRHVLVEEDRLDRGVLRSVVDAELTGISYDRRDGNVQIVLDGDDRGSHRTVVVRDVKSVYALAAPDGRDVALRLAIPRGQVLLTFVPTDSEAAAQDGW